MLLKTNKIFLAVLLLAGLAASSCVSVNGGCGEGRRGDVTVAFTITPATGDTKSILTAGESEVRSVYLAAYRRDIGKLDGSGYFAGTGGTLDLLSGKEYDIYALVNIPGGDSFVPPVDEAQMREITLSLPDFASINASGIPMSGAVTGIKPKANPNVTIDVTRLLAKLILTIDHTGLTGADGPDLSRQNFSNLNLDIRNANRTLAPFREGGSRALASSDILPSSDGSADMGAETPFDPAQYACGAMVDDATFVYYIPENRQGLVYDGGTDLWSALITNGDPAQKIPSVVSAQGKDPGLLTYVEFTGGVPDTDGYGGSIRYRFFLGQNATDNFDVRRNDVYTYSLSMLLSTALDESEWKCEQDDWTDTRALMIVGDDFRPLGDDDPVIVLHPGEQATAFVYYNSLGEHADDDPMETALTSTAPVVSYPKYTQTGKFADPDATISGLAQRTSGWYTNFFASDPSKVPEGQAMASDGLSVSFDSRTNGFTFAASPGAVTGKEYDLNFFLLPGKSTPVRSVKIIVLEPLGCTLYHEDGVTPLDPSYLYEGFGVWMEVRGIVSDKFDVWDYGRPDGDLWQSQVPGVGARGCGTDHVTVTSGYPQYPRYGTAETVDSQAGYRAEYDKTQWVYLVLSEGTTKLRVRGRHPKYDTDRLDITLTAKPVSIHSISWQKGYVGQAGLVDWQRYTFFIDGTVADGDSWVPAYFDESGRWIPEDYFTQAFGIYEYNATTRYLLYPSVFARGMYGLIPAGANVNHNCPEEYSEWLPFNQVFWEINKARANSPDVVSIYAGGGWVSGSPGCSGLNILSPVQYLPAGPYYDPGTDSDDDQVFQRPWNTWERVTLAGHCYNDAHIYMRNLNFALGRPDNEWNPDAYKGKCRFWINNPEVPFNADVYNADGVLDSQAFDIEWKVPYPWNPARWASDYYIHWGDGGFDWSWSPEELSSSPENVSMTFPDAMINLAGFDVRGDMSYKSEGGRGHLIWDPDSTPGRLLENEHFYPPNGDVTYVKTIRNIHSGQSISKQQKVTLKHRIGVCQYAEFINGWPSEGKNTVRIWLALPRRAYLDATYNTGTVQNPVFEYGGNLAGDPNSGGIDSFGSYPFRSYAGFDWGVGSGGHSPGWWISTSGEVIEQEHGAYIPNAYAEYTFSSTSPWTWDMAAGDCNSAELFLEDTYRWWNDFYTVFDSSATPGMYRDDNQSNPTLLSAPRFMDSSGSALSEGELFSAFGLSGVNIESFSIVNDPLGRGMIPYVIRSAGGM